MVTLLKYHFIIIGVVVLLTVCHPVYAFKATKKQQFIILVNPTAFDRPDEVITVQRKLLGQQDPIFVPEIKKGNQVLTSQVVDTNNDGSWEELLVEISIKANAADTLQIIWVNKKSQVLFKKVANVQLSLRSDNTTPSPEILKMVRSRGFTQNIAKPYYQMEGPGIENDKVAFRAFFDYRNGKDIYGKIVDTPVLEKVGVGATWHELQPWGMDILKVGNSLGAGALAVLEKWNIYRLADADTSLFESLYEGPLQAAFKLSFTNWDVGTGKQNGSETISITKGNFFYRNDISVPLNNQQKLIAGIANFSTDASVYKKYNPVFSSISTYGPQAEGTQTKLGLAILFPSGDYVTHKTADSTSTIPNTSYVVLQPSDKKRIYFFACWEKTDTRFREQQGFKTYLQQTAALLAHPIQIKIITTKRS